MAKRKFNAVVATGSYQDRNGQTKKKWLNIGVVMENDDGGLFLLLDRTFNPAGIPVDNQRGHGPVLVSFFEPEQNDAGQRRMPSASRATQQMDPDEDTPF